MCTPAGVILCREPLLDVVPLLAPRRRMRDRRLGSGRRASACSRWTSWGCATSPSWSTPAPSGKPGRRVVGTLELADDATFALLAGATPSGCSSSTAGRCARCWQMARRQVRGHLRRARVCTGPARWGQRPHRLRRAQERAPSHRADPPRAGRAAGRDPRGHVRPDRLPGTGHGDRAEGRRLHPRQRRPAAARDGQEEEGDPRQGVRALLRGHDRQRVFQGCDRQALGDAGPVLGLCVQPRPHRRLRPGVVLDRLPQGQLPERVHGRPAH